MNLILVDSSYTSFYRFFATKQWFGHAHKEDYEKIKNDPNYDWSKNEIFMKTYEKMYLGSIKKLIGVKVFKNSKIIFCQDDHRHTLWRNQINDQYKEGRPDLSLKNNFKPVFKYTYETLIPELVKENDNIISFRVDTIEADDIIAVISQITKDINIHVYLISGDDDFTQLGRNNLTIMKYGSKNKKETSEEESAKLLLKKIINGDKSDNIPSIFKNQKISSKIKKELIDDENKLNKFLDENKDIQKLFNKNRELIDFNYMPKDIRTKILKVVDKKILN
jgi:5'-3' exonuclease